MIGSKYSWKTSDKFVNKAIERKIKLKIIFFFSLNKKYNKNREKYEIKIVINLI